MAQRWNSSMTAALEGGEWSAARPGHTLPPGKTWYPFYRRLGGPQGRSGLLNCYIIKKTNQNSIAEEIKSRLRLGMLAIIRYVCMYVLYFP